MYVLGNFIIAVANIFNWILWVYFWLIFGRAIISWVNADPYNPIVRFLHVATEPVLDPCRRILSRILPTSRIDFSPIVAFLAIWFIRDFVVQSLIEFGYRLK